MLEASELVGISFSCAIKHYKKVRNLCIEILHSNLTEIGGNGIEVEIDESHIFKAKNNTGRILKS